MMSMLSRREKYLLKKFWDWWTAWCPHFRYVAHLIPPPGTKGKHERVRTDTLTHLVSLGYLTEEQTISPVYKLRGDIHWAVKNKTAEPAEQDADLPL